MMKNMLMAEKKQVSVMNTMLNELTNVFSRTLEEEVTPKQTLLILNVFLAILATLLSSGISIWFTLIGVVWMAYALHLCKKEEWGEKR